MNLATVQEASVATGWSPRMLRYVEQRGLVTPQRSGAGYRLYGQGELDRLRSLRVLLEETGLELSDIAIALRLRQETALASAVDGWLDGVPVESDSGATDALAAGTAQPTPSTHTSTLAALRWEQERQVRLLRSGQGSRDTVKDAS